MDSFGDASVRSVGFGTEKYGDQGLLASSVALGRSGLSAALRTHDSGVITPKGAQPETEVCVPIGQSHSRVTRVIGRIVDRAMAEPGRAWLCPAGLEDYVLEISAPVLQVLHIYLLSKNFTPESLGVDVGLAVPTSLRYERSFRDPLVAEIAFAIVTELRTPTAGGKLLADTLAASLAARLVHRHTGLTLDSDSGRLPNQGLDRRRLIRVKEYIAAHLEGNLTIAQLAKVASLSQFHFARAFKGGRGAIAPSICQCAPSRARQRATDTRGTIPA